MNCDILVAGGGLGGCAAALSAARMGADVILTEECLWIGGQLTSQGVSAPDEHPYIESFGCTQSYRQLRNAIRNHYRSNMPLKPEFASDPFLNPGGGWVSRLCHDPRVSLECIQAMLAPYLSAGNLRIFTRLKPLSASVDGCKVKSVGYLDIEQGDIVYVDAKLTIDATETGELLPLTGCQYVTGAESQSDTGEPHALPGSAEPFDIQSFTYCFFLERTTGADTLVEKPDGYEYLRESQPLSWTQVHPITLQKVDYILWSMPGWSGASLWTYRRVLDASQFIDGIFNDVTLVNWPHNDYRGNIIDCPPDDAASALISAKNLAFSLIYWLQNEAPRPDGGQGFPELRLCPEYTGTADGLAQYPYIRESRRIVPVFRVLEQHIAHDDKPGNLAEQFADSVGIGLYRIDLHPSASNRPYLDIDCRPFQIPLGALIPLEMQNLLAGCKNIGTTHITNGAYRLHPIEWNIGESAGALAAVCVKEGLLPVQVRENPARLTDFQKLLADMGVELSWPDYTEHV